LLKASSTDPLQHAPPYHGEIANVAIVHAQILPESEGMTVRLIHPAWPGGRTDVGKIMQIAVVPGQSDGTEYRGLRREFWGIPTHAEAIAVERLMALLAAYALADQGKWSGGSSSRALRRTGGPR